MAVNYPTSLDNWTNPTGSDTLATTPHSTHHANHYDAIEAIEKRTLGLPLVWLPHSAVAVRTSRSFGWKGPVYTPNANQTLYGVRAYIQNLAASQTVQAAVITVSAGAVATITKSDVLTVDAAGMSGAPLADFMFSSPVALTSGVVYGLVVGYSSTAGSATSTTDFPLYVTSRAVFAMALPRAGAMGSSVYHLATTNPAVATSVTTAAADQLSGASTYAIGPIFDWA